VSFYKTHTQTKVRARTQAVWEIKSASLSYNGVWVTGSEAQERDQLPVMSRNNNGILYRKG